VAKPAFSLGTSIGPNAEWNKTRTTQLASLSVTLRRDRDGGGRLASRHCSEREQCNTAGLVCATDKYPGFLWGKLLGSGQSRTLPLLIVASFGAGA
jgi:hypothetical protein